MEKRNCLKSTFDPFLKVLHPEWPGTVEETQALVAASPSAFSLESSRTIHSELAVFFEYALREHKGQQDERQAQDLEAKPMICTIAATFALRMAKHHGLYKLAGKVYRLFLTAVPSVLRTKDHSV